jgi:hypothetical protein
MDRSLEQDIKNDSLIMKKIKDRRYAQNVYAALCNMRWQPAEVWPMLKDEYWSCSWRYAGGLVAELRCDGDYMDWYCSGIGNGFASFDDEEPEYSEDQLAYVSEGTVTDEICEDFARMGWHPSPWPEDDK